jgi:hypothetical protein
MRTDEYRGRRYDACWTRIDEGVYRGTFDVESTSPTKTDGVINEATTETFSTLEAAEEAAVTAARRWIDYEADKT